MKLLVVIIGVLAATEAVYGYNANRLQKYAQDYLQCNRELGGSPSVPRFDTIRCAMLKDSEIMNANGEYIRGATLERLGDLISDAGKVQQAQAMMAKCYDDAVMSGATGDEQTIQVITCSLPALAYIDNSQYM